MMNKLIGNSIIPFATPKNIGEKASVMLPVIPSAKTITHLAPSIPNSNARSSFIDLITQLEGTTHGAALLGLYCTKPSFLPQQYIKTKWIGFVQNALKQVSFGESDIDGYITIHEEGKPISHLELPNVIRETIIFFDKLFHVLRRSTREHIYITLNFYYNNYKATSRKMASDFVAQLAANTREANFTEEVNDAVKQWAESKRHKVPPLAAISPVSVIETMTIKAQQPVDKVLIGYIDIDTLRDILRKFKMIGPDAISKPLKWVALRSALESLNLLLPLTDQEASNFMLSHFGVKIARNSFNRRVETEKRNCQATRLYRQFCEVIPEYKPA